MFTVDRSFGEASWHNTKLTESHLKYAELIIKEIVWDMDDTKESLEVLEQNWSVGKIYFRKKKDVYLARIFFENAFIISESYHGKKFAKEKVSLLYSNVALCSLKLEEPRRALAASKKALHYDKNNIKAFYLAISSLYILYEFDEALNLIAKGLRVHPESEDLNLLHEKVLGNKIQQKFSREIIQERLAKYKDCGDYSIKEKDLLEALNRIIVPISKRNEKKWKSTAENVQHSPWIVDAPTATDIRTLSKYVQENNKSAVLVEAKRVLDEINRKLENSMPLKNFNIACYLVVDKYYINHMLKETFGEDVDEEMYHIFREKATCLYYLDEFNEALECCHKASRYKPDTMEVLSLEAKILCKLEKFDEALEIIDRCLKIVDPNSVEAVICEEILLEINFKKDTQKRKQAKKKDNAKIQKVDSEDKMKETNPNPNTGEEMASGQDHYRMLICRLCGIVVSTQWSEHIETNEHQNLLKGKMQKAPLSGSAKVVAEAEMQSTDLPPHSI